MVDKPKTYPQKIAELQEVLAAKDSEIERLKSQVDAIPTMQKEIDGLKADLILVTSKTDNKAQMVDLTQRAESAEKQVKNLLSELGTVNSRVIQLESALDIAGAERDKNLGKDQKIEQLSEELKRQNLTIANANTAIADIRREATEQVAKAERAANQYRQAYEANTRRLNEFIAAVDALPDFVSDLKRLL